MFTLLVAVIAGISSDSRVPSPTAYRARGIEASDAAWAQGVELRRATNHEVHAFARVPAAPAQQVGRPGLDATKLEVLQQQHDAAASR